jgi:hypothetical protein
MQSEKATRFNQPGGLFFGRFKYEISNSKKTAPSAVFMDGSSTKVGRQTCTAAVLLFSCVCSSMYLPARKAVKKPLNQSMLMGLAMKMLPSGQATFGFNFFRSQG